MKLYKKTSFAKRVREVVRSIKKGKTLTYGAVAALAGSRGAARAVGSVMKNNYDPTVPCHRVVRSDGRLASYNRGGTRGKEKILKKEGIAIHRGQLVRLG